MPIAGPRLVDKTKVARWSDSMCLHCVHGDDFPDCPNDYSDAFPKDVGPIMCSWFEEKAS
ncbi:MAG: hypothetical protein FDZ70_10395 [Actinobacteria bacterium]|nr:MAG: hypothetical protein FDZ70_10395 [Actinomycetota bacterium]